MRDKDYRELQISSSLLVFIFLAVLILGVVIFLLGVSVGKKQAQIVASSEIPEKKEAIQVEKKEPVPIKVPKDTTKQKPVAVQKVKEEVQKQAPIPKDQYFIQVGAFNNKNAASTFSDQFKKEGFPVVVLEPYSSDKKPVYRVRIGGYPSREDAEKAKAQLRSTLKVKDSFIIKG
jgi:cell division septation protein DedD